MEHHGTHHPGASPACPACLGLGVRLDASLSTARALRCDCVGPCSVCEDGGWVARGPNVVACTCHTLAERMVLYDEAGLPAASVGPALERWELTPLVERATAWLTGWRPEPGSRGLVISDPAPGRGERLLGALVAELVFGLGARVRCVDLRVPDAIWPQATEYRVLALIGLGEHEDSRALKRGLSEHESSDGSLLVATRLEPTWERTGATASLGEVLDPSSAVTVLESCLTAVAERHRAP